MMENQELTEKFTPTSLTRESTVLLSGTIDQVFPLFEPLNEKRWVKGWDPEIIYPENGLAMKHMIFQTKPRFAGESSYRWILTNLDKQKHVIEYTVSTEERIWFIAVTCRETGQFTEATIRYSYVGLTPRGQALNELALDAMFKDNMCDWKEAINQYLSNSVKSN